MKKVNKNDSAEQLLKSDERREFLDKFGKLAAAVPAGMLLLMGPQANAQPAISGADNDSGG